MLRIFFNYNRRLLGDLYRCALRSLTRYFEVLAGSELIPGVITAIQTFGNRINVHPRLHFLVTEGGVDKAGLFYEIPRSTTGGWPSSSAGRSWPNFSARSF